MDRVKTYKRTMYWLNTNKFCAGVSVDQDGYVYNFDTAPCYMWAAKKKMKFSQLLNYYKSKKWLISCKKLDVEIDPF